MKLERGRAAAGGNAAEESPLTIWTADAHKCVGRESWLWNRNDTAAQKCDEPERARSCAFENPVSKAQKASRIFKADGTANPRGCKPK